MDDFVTSLVAVRAKMLSNDSWRSLIFMLITLLVIFYTLENLFLNQLFNIFRFASSYRFNTCQ